MSCLSPLRKYSPKFINTIHDILYYQYIKHFPKRHAEVVHYQEYGKHINWDNPQSMAEKGRWIQFYTDTSLWPLLADKYRVREYLEQKGYADNIPKLYGVWVNAKDINISELPNQFVIKTNHGSGGVFVVEDKTKIDFEVIRIQLDLCVKNEYGVWTAEPHYTKIKPVIIAEELLPNTCDFSSSIVDYKFFCSYGEPFIIGVPYDRDYKTRHCSEVFYDADWHNLQKYQINKIKLKDIPCPLSFEKMKDLCRELTSDFPLIRLDFYDVNGHVYIGEFTMTPEGFLKGDFSITAIEELGRYIDLSRVKCHTHR